MSTAVQDHSCGNCGVPLGEQYGPGRIREYCKPACRVAAWRRRQDPFAASLRQVLTLARHLEVEDISDDKGGNPR